MTRPPSLAESLKRGTADEHEKTEAHPFQSRLGGEVSLDGYYAYLASLGLLHDAIDQRLQQLGAAADPLRELIPYHRHRQQMLQLDLHELSRRAPRPAPGDDYSHRLADWIAELDVAGLVGVLYVIEGSANGGHYAAKGLRDALGFNEQAGTRFLDPHGDEQHPKWREYKLALDRLPLGEADVQSAVVAAQRCFRAFAAASDRAAQVENERGG